MVAITIGPVWLIYKITCVPSGKLYIGLTCQRPHRRWQAHIRDAINRRYNSLLHKAIRRYGPTAFSINVLSQIPDRATAARAEITAIAQYATAAPNGYNLAEGGYGGATIRGRKRSAETCVRISKRLTGRKMDPEVVERVAAKLRGRKLAPDHAAIIRTIGRHNKGKRRTIAQRLANRLQKRIYFLKQSEGESVPGCYKSGLRFRVRIMRDGRRLDLGSFDTLAEAKATYIAATMAHIQQLKAGMAGDFSTRNTSLRRSDAMKISWAKRKAQKALPSANPHESQP